LRRVLGRRRGCADEDAISRLPSALSLLSQRSLYRSRDDLIVDSLKARRRREP